MPRKGKVALTQVAIILGLVLIWELGVRSGLIDPFFFPAPSAIVDRIMEWIATADFWTDLGISDSANGKLNNTLSKTSGILLSENFGSEISSRRGSIFNQLEQALVLERRYKLILPELDRAQRFDQLKVPINN